MAVMVGITVGAIIVSAFTTPKQIVKTEGSQFITNNDSGDWVTIRKDVAYCKVDGNGNGSCVGYGDVRVDDKYFQVQIHASNGGWYDLTEYTYIKGYNMRFWYDAKKEYYYVNITIPSSYYK